MDGILVEVLVYAHDDRLLVHLLLGVGCADVNLLPGLVWINHRFLWTCALELLLRLQLVFEVSIALKLFGCVLLFLVRVLQNQ